MMGYDFVLLLADYQHLIVLNYSKVILHPKKKKNNLLEVLEKRKKKLAGEKTKTSQDCVILDGDKINVEQKKSIIWESTTRQTSE